MAFFFHYRGKPPIKRELSVILVLLKARHNLTDSCIDDLCSLLIQIGIKNIPTSFWQLKTCLSPQNNALDVYRNIECVMNMLLFLKEKRLYAGIPVAEALRCLY